MTSPVDEAISLISHFQLVQRTTVASVALLIYDWMSTFSDEVDLVWRSRWTVIKCLFYGTRYSTLVASSVMLVHIVSTESDTATCQRLYNVSTYLGSFGIACAIIILLIRVYALWERSKRILIGLLLFISIDYVFGLVVFATSTGAEEWLTTNTPNLVPCVSRETGAAGIPAFGIYVIIMLADTVMTSLTVWKGVAEWRFQIHHNTLLHIFYRDGVLYFICLFTLSIASFILNVRSVAHGDYNRLLLEMQCAFHSIITSRMILNLRSASTSASATKYDLTLDAISFESRVVGSLPEGSGGFTDLTGAISPVDTSH